MNARERKELKALVDHEKRNLLFYALFYDRLNSEMSIRELERAIDYHLDRLIALFEKLKQ